jgi:hypothetical protein
LVNIPAALVRAIFELTPATIIFPVLAAVAFA